MGNGNGKTDIQKLVEAEKKARATWYGFRPQGGRPASPEERTALKELEGAKRALVVATGTANFREAKAKAGYSPTYAVRGAKGTSAKATTAKGTNGGGKVTPINTKKTAKEAVTA